MTEAVGPAAAPPGGGGPAEPRGSQPGRPPAQAAGSRLPHDVTGDGVSAPGGSIGVVGDVLLLTGDIGTDLCLAFRATDRALDGVTSLDAREVTFLGSPGLSLLAEVARVRGAGVTLWASPAALRPLRLSGLDRLFDVRPVD